LEFIEQFSFINQFLTNTLADSHQKVDWTILPVGKSDLVIQKSFQISPRKMSAMKATIDYNFPILVPRLPGRPTKTSPALIKNIQVNTISNPLLSDTSMSQIIALTLEVLSCVRL
jgi:hypothetical protein